MLVDQFLRRTSWRVRRWIAPATDLSPVVELTGETKQGPPRTDPPRQRRARSLLAPVGGFLLTLALIGGAWAVAAASASRLAFPVLGDSSTSGQSRALEAASSVLDWAADGGETDPVLTPRAKVLRRRLAAEGAETAVAAYLGVVSGTEVDARGLQQALVVMKAQAPGSMPEAERRVLLGALALKVAEMATIEASDLGDVSSSSDLFVTPAMEARLYRAQGAAFAWHALLQGALRDSPTLSEQVQLQAAATLGSLRTMADRQPLFLSKPGHFEDAQGDLLAAAGAARALAARLNDAR